MTTNKSITWATDLTTLWEDAFGQYSVHSLVGALFPHAPQDVIDRLAQQATDELDDKHNQHQVTKGKQKWNQNATSNYGSATTRTYTGQWSTTPVLPMTPTTDN